MLKNFQRVLSHGVASQGQAKAPNCFNVLTMYHSLLSRFVVVLSLCSFYLQGCRSALQVTSEEPVFKKARKTIHDERSPNQLSVPPNVYDSGLSIAASVNSLSSSATAAVQITSPTRHLAGELDVGFFLQQALPTEPEEIDTKPAARLTSVFGVQAWSRYFGEVGEAPTFPADMAMTWDGPCPFWPDKAVKDTHLLALIPATVDGKPFNLDLLGALIKCPKGEGYPTEYSHYRSDVQGQFGAQSPARSYWVLMTNDVLKDSRSKKYASQKALVARHASRTGLPYELPSTLEAATVILSHYVRSGERLYTNAPWTYTRCQDLVAWNGGSYPAVVGGFSSGGLDVRSDGGDAGSRSSFYRGVSSLRKFTETDTNSVSRVTAQVAKLASVGRLASLQALPFQAPTVAFGAREWGQYWGEVDTAPFLPSDIAEILNSPEIREESTGVLCRQLEVLSLTQTSGTEEHVRLLASFKEELLVSLREKKEKYEQLLLRHKEAQRQLELAQKEEMTHLAEKQTPLSQAAMPAEAFGAKEWEKYFGKVGTEPDLPPDINEILEGPCPFWSGKQVKDTHLLVLIPPKVDGKPFSLDLLSELIQHPQGEGHSTQYRFYNSNVQAQLGAQSPGRSYWVLMTRDVLEGSRGQDYASHQALVAAHAKRTSLPYELPGVLEAATAILSHYVRSGERLYTDDPWTYTRCRESVTELLVFNFSVYVGGFSSGGLIVGDRNVGYAHNLGYGGVAGFRKF